MSRFCKRLGQLLCHRTGLALQYCGKASPTCCDKAIIWVSKYSKYLRCMWTSWLTRHSFEDVSSCDQTWFSLICLTADSQRQRVNLPGRWGCSDFGFSLSKQLRPTSVNSILKPLPSTLKTQWLTTWHKTWASLMGEIFTLYLSTMGNLTGPSLDLFKFGKLSKCGMKGKPLEWHKGGEERISNW